MSWEDEEELLRSVALQNARSILLERQRVERELAQERERLRITLASIADAVISTDNGGRVVFLNRVAEALTGWPEGEARGRPLGDIFRIVDATTRVPIEDPALRALTDGRVVTLPQQTLLISRDGIERPIDDSAAPMWDISGAVVGAVLVFRDVTEKARAEEAHARLAAVVASSEDAIISKSLEGIILSWNSGAQRIFGYTDEEAIGRSITMLIPPERLDEEASILARLRRGERIDHFETVRVAKDGRRMDISLSVSPVKDHQGRVIGASKIAREITDQKRAEQALRESEARHRFLADLATATQPLTHAADIMATTARLLAEHLDVDRCAYAEVEDETVFVITGDHARGVSSIVGRWLVADFGPECERRMLANEPYVIDDVETDLAAGSDLDAYRRTNIQAVICIPLHKAGKFAAAMAVHQSRPRHWTPAEISLVRIVVGRSWESLERMRVARGLEETADRLALAFAAARLGDFYWDSATDAVTVSLRTAEIFGIPPASQMTWTEMQCLLHVDDREHARLEMQHALSARTQYDIEFRVRRPDGQEVWVSVKGQAQCGSVGLAVGVLGLVQDITEKKRLEHDLRQKAKELAEADRKKDDFIALLAHELRNPLAPIRTGLEVLRLAAGDPNKVARARAIMDRQLSHMVRLIDDLLDVSRLSRSKLYLRKTRILLAEVVSHAVEAVAPLIEAAGHDLQVTLSPDPLVLDADLTRLTQVLGNLLTNSAKYTPRGGRIWLTAERHGPEVVITVRDTGIGIPPEDLPHVFDMFAQGDRSIERVTGGLGIGLALVRGLVEMHAGTVTAESAGSGLGSNFTVRLPVVDRRSEDSAPIPAGNAVSSTTGRRVLVVDDYADGADSLATMMQLLGNEVHVARDGLEAVQMAEQVRPDLILMDVGMPRMNGLDAARRIRESTWGREMTIVTLTGWGQGADRERSREAGCDAHLVKPINLGDLEKVLEALPARNVTARNSQ